MKQIQSSLDGEKFPPKSKSKVMGEKEKLLVDFLLLFVILLLVSFWLSSIDCDAGVTIFIFFC
jgi:hypothetical protein